jgi:selenocysteine lyase/cysteine desulfurase
MPVPTLSLPDLRAQTLGIDAPMRTPFGERRMVYADFTASGRQLAVVEDYLRDLAATYANSHTEDSLTGREATRLLHEAEASIKRSVHAGPHGKVVCCGAGSTAAIHKLQEFLGVAIPPATRAHLLRAGAEAGDALAVLRDRLTEHLPVVFVGPFEHHSNEVTWREGLCTTVEIGLNDAGTPCLDELDRALADPRWAGRRLLGSFSAASNVTGVVSPVHEIARVLHHHGALAFFDFAAGGPYLPIDMCPDGDPEGHLDAVFLSPHKFLGGPGAAGVLVFHERVYPSGLAPSVGGGGTVDYVWATGHDFTADIEAREKAGTPGFYQTLRAALALEVKDAIGAEVLHAREQALGERALDRWRAHPNLTILGPEQTPARIGIVSFTVHDPRVGGLHPKLVTRLLNDLFGIQSRAGCSCAGPYGHHLLGIDDAQSVRYREASHAGLHGIKPGWCRVGFHVTMDDLEANYIIAAVAFVASEGGRFLPLYAFDIHTGAWTHRDDPGPGAPFGLTSAIAARPASEAPLSAEARAAAYTAALDEARALADALPAPYASREADARFADLQTFALA